ncbi:MAG: hypothetical protein NC328_03975 [Muribaculum sp.]|nr:hypothetical protein [Muribaculum sp.]
MKFKLVLMFVMLGGIIKAQNYVVIAKEAQVYDAPKANTYKTLNQDGQEVILSVGMAFKMNDSQNGWDKVEYTPGLNGYILHSQEATDGELGMPQSGKYQCRNINDSVTVTQNGEEWMAISSKGEFNGEQIGKVLVFKDRFGNPYYTLVVLNGTPLLMTYDNAVTHLF